MKIKYLVFIMFIFQCYGFAQTKTIDSLLTVLKIQKEDTNKVKTLIALCDEYEIIGNYSEGLKNGNRGITLALKLNFQKGLAKCYNNIGVIYKDQSNYPKALEYYSKSLKVVEEMGFKKGISSCYGNIGNIYVKQSDYPKALKYYTKALKIFEESGDKNGISALFINIGHIYYDQRNYPKALEYYNKSLKVEKEMGDKNGISSCYQNIGNIYIEQTNYPKALEYYTKALKINEELGDKSGESGCYSNIGVIYYYESNYPKASEYYTNALKINQELGDKEGIADIFLNLSGLNIELKKYSLAKQQAIQAISISKEIGAIDNMLSAYGKLALAEEGLGNYKAAYFNHKRFKELNDSIFNTENSKQLSDIKTKFEVEKKEAELRAAQDKKDAVTKEKERRQRLFLLFVAVVALALGSIVFIVFRNLRITRKQKNIIELQKEEVEKQREIVQHQKEIVEEKNHEILQSITYAQRLQNAILPPLRIVKEYLKESFILYKPKDIVAGDFYWMETIEKNIVLFGAADCTGHGVPGAMVSVVCSNALNRTVKEFGLTTPGLILDKVRALVIETFVKSESEIKDGMDISLCALNTLTGELQWAGANNPLWIIRNETKELETIKPDKQPIGKTENPIPFTTHHINLNIGDSFYIFTDGYQDQFGGEKGKKFMAAKMKDLFINICTKSMQEQQMLINETIEDWKGKLEQVDDICIIGVRI